MFVECSVFMQDCCTLHKEHIEEKSVNVLLWHFLSMNCERALRKDAFSALISKLKKILMSMSYVSISFSVSPLITAPSWFHVTNVSGLLWYISVSPLAAFQSNSHSHHVKASFKHKHTHTNTQLAVTSILNIAGQWAKQYFKVIHRFIGLNKMTSTPINWLRHKSAGF